MDENAMRNMLVWKVFRAPNILYLASVAACHDGQVSADK